jgi:hypothetical protein
MKLNMMKNTFGEIDLKLGFQPAFLCCDKFPGALSPG